MRIGIDARFYGSLGKGLGRYTQKLIENLEKLDKQNQYFIFLNKENFNEYQPKKSNFKKVLAGCHWYTFKEQFKMPFLLWKYKLDLVHFPHFNVPLFCRNKFLVTIHDLILLHYPTVRNTTLNTIFYWIKFWFYKVVIRSAIMRSKKIITVSNFTKSDILKNYKINSDKIIVTYEAAENYCILPATNSDTILKKYGIIKPYLLYVGNAYPHKNLEYLIREFASLGNDYLDYRLILVGKEDYFYLRLKKLVREKNIQRIIFTDYVTDCDLDIIYKEAELYVFPSLYEGFGLPPLEAMAKGTPVLVSNHPCLKEILGESAAYADVKKKGGLAEMIKKILSDFNLKSELIRRGYRQCQKYTWIDMAKKTLLIYQGE